MVQKLREYRPDVLEGYPGVLAKIAENIEDDPSRLICPRLVVVGGEVLSPLMRDVIARAFAAPVFDFYASYEFKLLAWECKETGKFHVCDDAVILEVLKEGRPASIGERGEVVGTGLHSFAMPFIRFRLGDIVTRGSETCSCGQPFTTIREVQGRIIDYFLLPDGRVIHPYEILSLFLSDAYPWIRQYQLTQESEGLVVLRVVPSTIPPHDELAHIEASVKALLGPGVDFQTRLVSEIKVEPSGKFRPSRSLVKSDYDGIDWNRGVCVTSEQGMNVQPQERPGSNRPERNVAE